ncbi:MAG: hypothetical protein ACI4MY_04700 [Christensenellales bacterium]
MHKFPYRPKCGTCHDRCDHRQCDARDNDCRRPDCGRRPPPRRDDGGCCNDLLIGLLIGTMLGDCCRPRGDRHGR